MPQQEIERKYLLRHIPEELASHPHEAISQGYISISNDGAEVRLRQRGQRFYETVKRGSGQGRVELEIEITKDQFDALWDATEGKRIEKVRYTIPLSGGLLAEVDIYARSLAGLVTAEVEFDTERRAAEFHAPAWFGEEVTQEDAYKNQRLAVQGLPR
jgi:CYTH domain-containing protein